MQSGSAATLRALRFVPHVLSARSASMAVAFGELRMTLNPPVDLSRDHVLGPPDAEMTLVQYGSYACRHCHAVHEVVEGLREPLRGSDAVRVSAPARARQRGRDSRRGAGGVRGGNDRAVLGSSRSADGARAGVRRRRLRADRAGLRPAARRRATSPRSRQRRRACARTSRARGAAACG